MNGERRNRDILHFHSRLVLAYVKLPTKYSFLLPLSLFPSIGGSGQGCPQLRASNEHILIVRVLRARRAPGHSRLLLHDLVLP
jgi:hypothetical protein